MTTKIRPRTLAVLVASIALLGVVAVTIPSSGAAEPGVVRLNLGSDGRYFEYGTARQNLSTQNNSCEIKPPAQGSPNIMALSSAPNQSAPGLGADGIGVKLSRSSGNGTPCTQVEAAETLTLAPGATLGGKLFKSVRLDLEMTGDAKVILRFSGGATGTTPDVYELQTGTSIQQAQKDEWTPADKLPPYLVSSGPGDQVDACAAPNSSGPNSGGNDNCQWTVVPLKTFSTVTLTTTQGTVALEGGGDFPSNQDRDSLFVIANSGPTAVDDSRVTNEDTTLNGTSVLANDSDPDGDPMKALLVTGPSHGTLSLAENGAFTYVPVLNYSGPDSFTYRASDGSVTSATPATVSITVAPVNDRPVAQSSTESTPEETKITVTVATDVDDTELTSSCTASEPGGTISDNGDGTVDYTPRLNFTGSVVLTCQSSDGELTTTSSAVITVGVTNVNDAPVGVDDAEDILANAPSVIVDVLGNDTDVDSATLNVTDIANVTPAGATAVPNADGTITYSPPTFIPARDFTAPGSFTYKAVDGGGLKSGVTTVTINPIICSQDEVTDTDGDVTGSFTRLTDPFECKQFTLEASTSADTILFKPSGAGTVSYRGVLEFGPESAPAAGGSGAYSLLLRYDPDDDGPQGIKPVKWCINPQFDANNEVTSATLPVGESWCVASGYTKGGGTPANPQVITVWQVFGQDDPKFLR